jgi:integrase/recombinase XerD
MPTVKAMLDKRYKSKDNTHQILIRIRNGKDLRDIGTGYKVQEKDWKDGLVSGKHPEARFINNYIEHAIGEAKQYIAECKLHKRPIRLELIGKVQGSHSWIDYLLYRAKQYHDKGMPRTAHKASRAAKEFIVFNNPGLTFKQLIEDERAGRQLPGKPVLMEDLNIDFLRNYEGFLVKLGNDNNTRKKKFKFLRTWYQDAIKDGKAPEPNHFKEYKISAKPVRKAKLTAAEVLAIEQLELKPGPINDARNLWLFSYYCKGNRFETCITCRRSAIRNGRIYFKMNKGEKYISVKIHARLQAIIDYYPDGEYIFPYIKELPMGIEEYQAVIDSRNVVVNRNLKIIAGLAGISSNLSFHIARHTLAFHLKMKTDNIHVIKDALGHSKSSTTEQYLQSLDDETLDKEMDKLYGE